MTKHFNFIEIPIGSFVQPKLLSREKPKKFIRILETYEIQTTPVTQELFEEIMGYNPSHFKGKYKPVESVSFFDVQEFLIKLNQRMDDGYIYGLPTEDEWEYACRAETINDYYFDVNSIDDYCWYDNNSNNQTQEVGLKKPNDLGLYDMSGNVFEWTSSFETDYFVFRGGAWNCPAQYLRSVFRGFSGPGNRSVYVGFRLVRKKK